MYSYLKLLHIAAVIIFLGNVITGVFWMSIAVKTKDLKIIFHTIKGIIQSDRLFTIPGVIIITAGGIMAAIYGHLPLLSTGWILWSIIMFSISGIAFVWKVVPIQRKIYRLTLNQEDSRNFNWTEFNKVYASWHIWAFIALLTPLFALLLMVLKIPK